MSYDLVLVTQVVTTQRILMQNVSLISNEQNDLDELWLFGALFEKEVAQPQIIYINDKDADDALKLFSRKELRGYDYIMTSLDATANMYVWMLYFGFDTSAPKFRNQNVTFNCKLKITRTNIMQWAKSIGMCCLFITDADAQLL